MTEREALKLALEALRQIDEAMPFPVAKLAQKVIKEALAQPEQEHAEQMAKLGWQYFECPACGSEGAKAFPKLEQDPVAWRYKILDYFGRPVWTFKTPKTDIRVFESQPLYTSPPPVAEPHKRKPLTDEELRVIENKINPNMRWRSSDEEGITLYPIEYYELVRAIEAAHGIKGEA